MDAMSCQRYCVGESRHILRAASTQSGPQIVYAHKYTYR